MHGETVKFISAQQAWPYNIYIWHFKLMFYYIEVHLLDHYTQWIKMHGKTVKLKLRDCFLEDHKDYR
jgi:hypothetical protein